MLKLQEWLAEQNKNLELAPELTLTLIDHIALPEKEVRLSRVWSPEPEDRWLRCWVEGPEFQEEARDLLEMWTNEYVSNFRGVAPNLATESEEHKNYHQEIPKVGFGGCNPSQPLSTPSNTQTYLTYPTGPPLFEDLKPHITHSNPM